MSFNPFRVQRYNFFPTYANIPALFAQNSPKTSQRTRMSSTVHPKIHKFLFLRKLVQNFEICLPFIEQLRIGLLLCPMDIYGCFEIAYVDKIV